MNPMPSLLRKTSAWLPIALSLAMLAFLLILLGVHGLPTPDENKDEGVAAHLFQLWLFVEAAMLAVFAVKWLPREPKPALIILVIQILAVALACFPVFYFQL